MYVFLLPFEEPCLLLEVMMRLGDLVVDDSKCQVDHKEGANEDHEHEVQKCARVRRVHS